MQTMRGFITEVIFDFTAELDNYSCLRLTHAQESSASISDGV